MSVLTTTLATETSLSQIQNASPSRCDNERLNGRWTKEEHQSFVEAIKLHGKNWKKVEEYVGTRTGAQIRSHAQKFFLKLEKEIKTSQKGKGQKEQKRSSKKVSERSISTSDNISDSGKSDSNLKGNLPFTEIFENTTEASENATVLPINSGNGTATPAKNFADSTNVATKTNEMQLENAAEIDYSNLSKAQLLSKLKGCEEKVDFFHQFVKNFTATQTNSTTSNYFGNPLSGKSYHHFVYLDLMSYFGGFDKTAKSLKISDFVDLSYKPTSSDDSSFENPAGKKKVKVL
jgi:SHAQKYF class myb-like DNA-binding protein